MQKIYIDVSKLTTISYLTGIQRVVRNVSCEMYKVIPERLCFLAFEDKEDSYRVLDTDKFIAYLEGDKSLEGKIFSGRSIKISEMKPGDIFFEIDAIWNTSYKRSVLLPKLKRYGVKIAVYIYDILPIILPQYTHDNTRFNFMNYIGAYLQYADVLIVSAKSTLDEIYKLSDRLGLPHIPGFVSWLGSDFNKSNDQEKKELTENDLPEDVKKAVSRKYILNVGTIEPRKNHDYLIDAFEEKLFDEGLNLVFVGRIGWNVDKLKERIDNHPKLNENLFHLEGLNDEALNYLYSHAYMVAFPTFNEGFGLPIVESLQRGTPVMASDVPVLREVGGEYCDYFDPNDCRDFIDKLNAYLNDEDKYNRKKESIKDYTPFTWKETSERIIEALDSLKKAERKPNRNASQLVILSARAENIKRSIPYIEEYMSFIEKLLICCPRKLSDEMKSIKTKRLTIDVLTDEEILNGEALPKDHGTRNFFLRCLAMKSPKVDDVFIMSDDDYRPLKNVDLKYFVDDDSYKAYYFYELNEWKGLVGGLSSYDRYIFRTRDFVNENHYPGYAYSSHMPQIIDKTLYLEMINEHKGIEKTGLDEWSSYFNYVQYRFPDLIESKPYSTVCWPGLLSDWKMSVKPEEYVFENFYEESYKEGEIFEGLSTGFGEDYEKDNAVKLERIEKRNNDYFAWMQEYERYIERAKKDRLEIPSFVISCINDRLRIGAPERIELFAESIVHIPFAFVGEKEGLSLQLVIAKENANIIKTPVMKLDMNDMELLNHSFDVVLRCGEKGTKKGNYSLIIRLDDGKETKEKSIALKLL
ncbi:MAG: glycosyltransferase family 4 protein [Lachnospiraceae bacterium]|nr:glycosyltransferase family 4 protein [Lachnospiraceae bacterium]